MATLQELEKRLAALEERVAEIKRDAAAARVLASDSDRDVTLLGEEIAAHTRVLSAMRGTQLEHGRVIDTLADHADECSGKLAADLTDIARLLRELIDRQ